MKKSIAVNLREFYEFGRQTLNMEIVAGEEHMDRIVSEAVLNRPGLAISGFQKYFANCRIQVIGMAEYAYLTNLGEDELRKSLSDFFKHKFPCMIMARNRKPLPEMIELAAQYKIPILRTTMVTYDFIHSATMLIAHMTAPTKKMQGTMVDIRGIGVLIQGEPMIGKSETALGLISLGHSLVADEITIVRQASWGGIIASAGDLTRFHMEIRGLGLIHVPSLFGIASVRSVKQLDMIVKLYRPDDSAASASDGMNNDIQEYTSVFGIKIPFIRIAVRAGRNVSELVELAALNQKLKQSGHDAAKELDDRVISQLIQKRGASD